MTSFLLLPFLGVRGSAFAASAINLIGAIGALGLDRAVHLTRARIGRRNRSASPERPFALVLYAIAGGIALGYEVVWSQAIVQFMSTRSFAFSVVLATYLAGLVVGSALYARWADRVRIPGASSAS